MLYLKALKPFPELALQARFPAAPTEIQASLLSAYMKMKVAAEGRDEALAAEIQAVFVR